MLVDFSGYLESLGGCGRERGRERGRDAANLYRAN
jgi:hypothetical protein